MLKLILIILRIRILYALKIYYWHTVKRCNNKVCYLKYMNKRGNCKNYADDITYDSNSNEFCSEQCGVEYQMETQ